jgi:hypothetical protein
MRHARTVVAVLILVSTMVAGPATPAEAQARPAPSSAVLVGAVRPPDAKEPLRDDAPAAIRRARYVVADVDAVMRAAAGDRTVELPLFDDTRVTTTADGVEGDAANLSWRGPVSKQGQTVGSLTMSAVGRYLYATVVAEGRLYRIEPVGTGVHAVYELATDALPDDAPSPVVHGETLQEHPAEEAKSGEADAPSGSSQSVSVAAASDPGSPPIDVLVVYTTAARTRVTDIRSTIQSAVNDANLAYANSGIGLRVRLVDSREVSYTTSGNSDDDLGRLRDPTDGYMDAVHGWRDTLGADFVQLWATGYNIPGGACGQGYLQDPVGATFEWSAFSVMDLTCQANYAMPHELGHNMGAHHDWAVMPPGTPAYSFNHGFTYSGAPSRWRTVMAYDDACAPCNRVAYFSNPDNTYNGTPMGVPEGQYHGADNRKTLNNSALTTASFRSISVGDGTRADLNGDGRDDVVNFQQGSSGQVWAALSNGSSLNPPTLWNPWGAFSYTGHLPAVGDVNGDGKADMVNFQQGNGQVWVALSNGSSFSPPTRWNPWGAFSNEGHVPRVGDVNGDGKADMVNFQRDSGGSVWVALSNGTTFNTPGQWGSGTAFSFRKATPRLGDVNGDGRADAVNFRQDTSGQVFVGLSTGSGFAAATQWNPWGAFSYVGTLPFTADLTGDGKADIVNFQQGATGQIWAATAPLLGGAFNLPTLWNPWGPFSYSGTVPM